MRAATQVVYFLASDRVLELALAFLNSFRRHNPEIPLCLIPYDRNISELNKLRRRFNFMVYSNQAVLARCDAISRQFHNITVGQYRKLAIWEGHFDEFIYIDVDTIVQHDLTFVFRYLRHFDFLTSHSNIPSIRKFTWHESIYGSDKLTRQQIDFAANTGYIVSKKGLLKLSQVDERLPEALSLKEHMQLMCTEQPLLNYLIVTSGRSYSSLYMIRVMTGDLDLPQERWAGSKMGVIGEGGVIRFPHCRVLFVHWAGQWQMKRSDRFWNWCLRRLGQKSRVSVVRRAMPYKELWKYFRNLPEQVESERRQDVAPTSVPNVMSV